MKVYGDYKFICEDKYAYKDLLQKGDFEIGYEIEGKMFVDMRYNAPKNILIDYINDPTIDYITYIKIYDGKKWIEFYDALDMLHIPNNPMR